MSKRKTKSLSLTMPHTASPIGSTITSPNDFSSGTASPSRTAASVRTQEVNEQLQWPTESNGLHVTSASPEAVQDEETAALTSLPSMPASLNASSKHGRDHSRSLFANLKASKSSNKVHKLEATIRQVPEDTSQDSTKIDGPTLYSLQKGPGSTPDLSLSTLNTSSLDVPGGESVRKANG